MLAAVLFTAATANAQLLKSNILGGYNEGDVLEKKTYAAKDDTPELDKWAGAFSSRPSDLESPVIGKKLSVAEYPETGSSIKLGTPAGIKGNRYSIYPIDDKKAFSKGILYLGCVIEMNKIAGNAPIDVIGLSASAIGASNRASIKVVKEGANAFKFATNLLKSEAATSMAYDYGKPHLVVMKIDYNNQTSSLYVDPKPGQEPSEADAVAHGDAENVLKHAIRSIAVRNRSGQDGNIGNIRLARTWQSLFSE